MFMTIGIYIEVQSYSIIKNGKIVMNMSLENLLDSCLITYQFVCRKCYKAFGSYLYFDVANRICDSCDSYEISQIMKPILKTLNDNFNKRVIGGRTKKGHPRGFKCFCKKKISVTTLRGLKIHLDNCLEYQKTGGYVKQFHMLTAGFNKNGRRFSG